MTDTTPALEAVTPEQVAAILKDVTPAPWSFFQDEDDSDRAYFGVTAPSGDVCMMSNARIWRGKQTIANARFIEWARNNIKALAADRDAQKARADAAEEARLDAIDTLNAWFDRRKLGHAAVDQAVLDAASGYLRTSRSGGMPQEESDLILGVVQDMARLGIFADLFARAIIAEVQG